MIILGIDPGSAALGYGVLERIGPRLRAIDFGCRSTSPDDTLPARLRVIHRQVADLVALHQPDLVGVERLYFSRNAQTAFAVGQARGVVLLAVAEAGIEIVEATPSAIKLAVAGHGRADKEQVGRMVATILGLDQAPRPDDAADALATAIWCAHLSPRREPARAGVLDRAAVAPLGRAPTSYDRAVQEALRATRNGTEPGRPSDGLVRRAGSPRSTGAAGSAGVRRR
jgi:crossover junction endodeoxyribonuclease RuvC